MAWSTIVLSIYSPPDWIDQRLQPILSTSTSQLIQEEENIHQNQKNSTPWKKDYSLKTILTKFTSPNIDKPFLLFVGGKGPGYLLITFYQYQALFNPNFLINAKFHILWQTSNFIANFTFNRKFHILSQISHFIANSTFYRKVQTVLQISKYFLKTKQKTSQNNFKFKLCISTLLCTLQTNFKKHYRISYFN